MIQSTVTRALQQRITCIVCSLLYITYCTWVSLTTQMYVQVLSSLFAVFNNYFKE